MRGTRVLFWLLALGLAVPAVTLSVVRLVDSESGPMIRVESFTPFGIPLYLALAVLLGAGALVQRRRTPALVALPVLAGMALHLWWFAPQVVGSDPPAATGAGAETVTVMNANLFEGRGDAEDVVNAVRRDGVDILVTEEITPTALAALEAAGLDELLPQRAGGTDEYVAGTMVFSSLPMGEPALLDTLYQSYRVQVGDLTLLAVHPFAPLQPGAWLRDHAVIRAEAVESGADLVVGDMNATPDHVVLRELDAAGFRDAGEVANEGWQPTWPANHIGALPMLPPVVRIDHVLVGSTMTALSTHTVEIADTDHLALVAEVAAR